MSDTGNFAAKWFRIIPRYTQRKNVKNLQNCMTQVAQFYIYGTTQRWRDIVSKIVYNLVLFGKALHAEILL